MKRVVLTATAVLFLITVGVISASPALAAEKAAPAAVAGGPETPPPPGVSPADPAMNPPDTDAWRCPVCGAASPRHQWRSKAPYGHPQLGPAGPGPAAERARPGRYGRAGDDGYRGAGPRYGMCGGCDRPGLRGGTQGRALRGCVPGCGARRGFGVHGVIGAGNAAERLLRNADELKLTDEQKGTLERLSYETQKTLADLRARVEKEQIEIKNLLQSGSDDLAAVKARLAAASQARADLQAARIENLFAARKVLTDKQKRMIKEDFPRLGTLLDD